MIVILIGAGVMLYGACTVYKNEGRAFLCGCLIAASGVLLSGFFWNLMNELVSRCLFLLRFVFVQELWQCYMELVRWEGMKEELSLQVVI